MSDMLAHLLGRYALFLEMVRGRYDLAKRYYRRALTVAPKHIPNRGRFAVFLEMVRSDHGRAEALYERVLEVAPNHRNGLFKCADFLTNVRHDYDGAEELYRRCVQVARQPRHADQLRRWAAAGGEGGHDRPGRCTAPPVAPAALRRCSGVLVLRRGSRGG